MGDLDEFYDGEIDLNVARSFIHQELDDALDQVLLDLLGEPPAEHSVTIRLVLAPSILRQMAELLP